jgi:pimeloyl-ACP methyl ester carboxylesterase
MTAVILTGVLATGCTVQKGVAPVHGLQMYYEIHGPSGDRGTPLVLLHGGGSTFETSFGDILPHWPRGAG